ncbi:MAG: DUF4346 domain-containing protein [Trichocoleus desertorum ATA4-8-CV12]|jgi:dihydropteroate synthase|nr:DUF4346 domain-containing protein [Trichocoleus desertorum ATA4-8-CV12]
MSQLVEAVTALDHKLSNRYIELDPGGYFIIYIDREANQICAKHYTNVINERGLAVDPETGEVIPVRGKIERTHTKIYSGRSAKELCIQIFESEAANPITRLDHAAYLGREFVRAEIAMLSGQEYIQD